MRKQFVRILWGLMTLMPLFSFYVGASTITFKDANTQAILTQCLGELNTLNMNAAGVLTSEAQGEQCLATMEGTTVNNGMSMTLVGGSLSPKTCQIERLVLHGSGDMIVHVPSNCFSEGSIPDECSYDEEIIRNRTYTSGTIVACRAAISILTSGQVTVEDGAQVTYEAPTIILGNGFKVEPGGIFHAISSIGGHQQSASSKAMEAKSHYAPSSMGGKEEGMPTAEKISFSDIPQELRELLAEKEGDKDLRDIYRDVNGEFFLFVTKHSLNDQDGNDKEDVYLFDKKYAQLTLVSRNDDREAGNGASHSARMDAYAENIVYQTEATDLFFEDNGPTSDIVHYDNFRDVSSIVSLDENGHYAEMDSVDPVVGSKHGQALYSRVDGEGRSHIYQINLLSNDYVPEKISFDENDKGDTIDNHHPGISGDERFVAYLETTKAQDGAPIKCEIHLYDQMRNLFTRESCPDAILHDPSYFPFFSEDNYTLTWFPEEVVKKETGESSLSDQTGDPIVMENPLAIY